MISRLVKLSFSNIFRNKRRSLITILSIGLGVFVIVFVRSFINGLQEEIKSTLIESLTGHIQVHKKGYVDSSDTFPLSLSFAFSPTEREELLSLPHVIGVAPRIKFGTLLVPADKDIEASFVIAVAVDTKLETSVTRRAGDNIVKGRFVKMSNDIVISDSLMTAFGSRIGEDMVLLARTKYGSQGAILLKIGGVHTPNLPGSEKKLIYVPLKKTQEDLLDMPGEVTEVAILLDDRIWIPDLVPKIKKIFGDSFEVHTWKDLAGFFNDIFSLQNWAYGIIMVVLFLIVISGVVNTSLMSVFERVREIGTLRAIGFARGHIAFLFISEAVFIGILGGFFGILGGSLVVGILHEVGIPFTLPGSQVGSRIFPFLSPSYTALAFFLSIVSGMLASVYPAIRASLMVPAEALRGV